MLIRTVTAFGIAVLALACTATFAERRVPPRETSHGLVAAKPPLGWNSFDAYDSRINEAEFKANVDVMADKLRPHGWQYAVIDYIWFNPAPGAHPIPNRRPGHPDVRLDADGRPIDRLSMDPWGRLTPAVERFPSAAQGKGFKPLADYVHGKGLKFGIHVMRGIPRQAYFDNTPILGSTHTAKDIAETFDTCSWNNNLFGIDAGKPGAQEYYDSLFELYAEWEIDLVKVDDIGRPYSKGEIEMIRQAIDRCGRPIVLSLSPGETPLGMARHVSAQANLWRISKDFWDDWASLRHAFDLLNAWSPFIGPSHWPDADMLPIGHLSLGGRPHGPDRTTRFTVDEQYTLLTLWSIARSPLMMGGDLPTSSPETFALLTNDEVLAVDQDSTDNRQVYNQEETVVWVARDATSGDRYVALFNLRDAPATVTFDLEIESMRGKFRVRDLWKRQDLGVQSGKVGASLGAHGAALYRLTAVGD